MLPSIFVIAYIMFLILINYRNHQLRKENQLVEKLNQPNCIDSISSINDSQYIMRDPFEKYDTYALIDHHVLM